MRLDEWISAVNELPNLQKILKEVKGKVEWTSISPEAKPMLISAIWKLHPRQFLIVAPTHDRAVQWQARLRLCGIPERAVFMLPSALGTLFEDTPPETGVLSERIGALLRLCSDEPVCIIATPGAATELTLSPNQLQQATTTLKANQDIELEVLIKSLLSIGYEQQEPVRLPGQFSRRGGIVDLFPMGTPLPVRVEMFGDTVESIREFDPVAQRSIRQVDSIIIPPARETLITDTKKAAKLADEILQWTIYEKTQIPEAAGITLEERCSVDAHSLNQGVYFDRLDLYRPFINEPDQCCLSYLNNDALLVLDEPIELGGQADRATEDVRHVIESRQKRGEILQTSADKFLRPYESLAEPPNILALNAMDGGVDWFKAQKKQEIDASSLSSYRGQPLALIEAMKTWLSSDVKVVVGTDQPHRASQMLTELGVHNFEAVVGSEMQPKQAMLVHGNLAGGFVMTDSKFAFVTDTELFGVARLRMPARRVHEGVPIASLLDLKPGDYVVHIYHGIGLFRGLVKMKVEDAVKEYLHVEYQHPDRIYVPVEQIDRIQKYLAPGEEKPSVSKLGGADWSRSVKSAREGARQLAGELTKLYAARQKAIRRPYAPDTPWQEEMESAFPYVETPSQANAIADVKEDMMKPNPMDRLVCGDVGFGKTEVAVRAAFKAVQDGRQVAVLCPTTILAAQHFDTFAERLAPYPTKIELMNRFRSPKQIKAALEGLANGQVDVVIGTHRLLSKDVIFQDLGLLIIDEEQRFGVTHKERIKQLKMHVDVLTLTATPIPRTLYMALMDIREMSVINDPPPGRLAIRTYVRAWDDQLVRDAILRELQRDGQVYVVHNRVESIFHISEHLQRLLPYARIGVGHGQMDDKQLEQVMIDFHDRKYDILVSTTIIENGLDMPNVNTVIVDQAHRLGLSQLYQLRGRVGRSDRQAYAYMLYRMGKQVNETAYQRLTALREFSQLGSGFSLAMRDLQIRGAGELLGAKQHGVMAGVGFELYMQLVSEAVHEIQGTPHDEVHFPTLPTVDLPVSAMIPDSYIEDDGQRLLYYKRIGAISEEKGINDLLSEFKDRYGDPPTPVRTAIRIVRLRLAAREAHLDKIEGKAGRINLWLRKDTVLSQRTIYQLQAAFRQYRIKPDGVEITKPSGDVIGSVEELTTALTEAIKEQSKPYVSAGRS